MSCALDSMYLRLGTPIRGGTNVIARFGLTRNMISTCCVMFISEIKGNIIERDKL